MPKYYIIVIILNMSDNKELNKVLTILNLTKFKQEINEIIEKYIEDLHNNGTSNNDPNHRIINQVVTYYEKMKNIYSCRHEKDDEDGFIDDDDDEEDENEDDENNGNSSDDSNDYSNIMEDRTYRNDPGKHELDRQGDSIRRRLLGINDLNNVFDDDDDETTVIDTDTDLAYKNINNSTEPSDSSADPVIYDYNVDEKNTPIDSKDQNENTENSESSEEDIPGSYIIRNIKKTYKNDGLNSEIVIDDSEINYDEPNAKNIIN